MSKDGSIVEEEINNLKQKNFEQNSILSNPVSNLQGGQNMEVEKGEEKKGLVKELARLLNLKQQST